MMQIAIIGESSNKIPRDIREKYPNIPWSEMISTRNVIVHNYSGIDLDTIWEVMDKDLPVLKLAIREIITKESNN